jgi:hypothetical protein
MTSASQLIALEALNRARKAAKVKPVIRPKTDSRKADKFVCRGFPELWEEMKAIGNHQGRSLNSECVAAVLDKLSGHVRSKALLALTMRQLGEEVSAQILADIPVLEPRSIVRTAPKFVIRFPDDVRDTVRDGVKDMFGVSMNTWYVLCFVDWVNIQRRQYALLSAAMAMDATLIEKKD